jgi:CheY-like chemotaxis protein
MPLDHDARALYQERGDGEHRMLILIVEDDPETRELYAFMLADAGFSLAVAGSATDAIPMAVRLHPDIILTDIGMPGPLDGSSMTRLLKENGSTDHIPVVAVTGYDPREVQMSADFEEVLSKPIHPDVLIASLRSVLGRAKA